MIGHSFYNFFVGTFFFWSLCAQTPYYGPTSPSQTSTVQVQLTVYDQPELGGLKIETVIFNGKKVALQPPDLHGFRGGGGFQLNPGNYQLEWKVSKEKLNWPRSLSYKQTIVIQPRDTWLQVTIQGDKATIL